MLFYCVLLRNSSTSCSITSAIKPQSRDERGENAPSRVSAPFAVQSVKMRQFGQHFLSGKLRQLCNIGLTGREQGGDGGLSFLCQDVAVSATDFTDQPMGAEQR